MRSFDRSGVIIIRAGERSEIVMIRQAAYIPKKVIDVPAERGTIQVTPTDLSYSSKSEYKIYKTSPWIRQTLEDHSAVLPDKTRQLTVDKKRAGRIPNRRGCFFDFFTVPLGYDYCPTGCQ